MSEGERGSLSPDYLPSQHDDGSQSAVGTGPEAAETCSSFEPSGGPAGSAAAVQGGDEDGATDGSGASFGSSAGKRAGQSSSSAGEGGAGGRRRNRRKRAAVAVDPSPSPEPVKVPAKRQRWKHGGVAQYECKICGKKFLQDTGLAYHADKKVCLKPIRKKWDKRCAPSRLRWRRFG